MRSDAVWLASLLAVVPLSGASGQELFGEVRSVMDGVFTDEQAREGEKIFGVICSECHSGEDLTGRGFLNVWTDRPLYALWEFVTTRMPYGAPGSLRQEEYAQVLAYILRLNQYPTGEDPLPHVPLDVANIDLVVHPD